MSQERLQSLFFARIADLTPVREMLDLLPDTAVFIKDLEGRFVYQNRTAYEACRVSSERETLGRRDQDFFPEFHAKLYISGDNEVITTGHAVVNRIEPAPDSPSGKELIVCSKFPLRDQQQQIIGVLCMYRRISVSGILAGKSDRLAKAVDAIHERFPEPLTSDYLAGITGFSRRAFDAQFRRVLGTSARNYLLSVRINAACRLLKESDKPITDVALEVGFYDHSHFNRIFQHSRSVSPTEYRKKYRA